MEPDEILFLGQSADASFYQRVMLPAIALGCDWCGLDVPPPDLILGRGAVRVGPDGPDLGAYRVVVVQTPAQPGWIDLIPELQAGGTKVLYDADYHLHEMVDDPQVVEWIETLLGLCDGVICATGYIAERYGRFNARTFLCENGIDLAAWAFTRPPHGTVNIGWSGLTLDFTEAEPWLKQIAEVMHARQATNFVTIGQPFANAVSDKGRVPPERCLAIPQILPDMYAPATSIFDLVFDPAGMRRWRLGRSQLRWLESAAAGLPMVGDPRIYPDIEDGVTGIHATDPVDFARAVLSLVDDPLLRASLGARAKEVVTRRYSMEALAPQWSRALEQVAA